MSTAKEKFLSFFLRAFKIIHYFFGSFVGKEGDIFLVQHTQKNESKYEKGDDVEEETKAKLICFLFFFFFFIINNIKSSDDDALRALFRDSVC